MKKEIYFAGGCFWGVEKFFSRLPGVLETQSGYANGSTLTPSYEDVCFHQTGHAETVRVVYSEERSLKTLIELFFEIIDPTAVNHQGMDRGNPIPDRHLLHCTRRSARHYPNSRRTSRTVLCANRRGSAPSFQLLSGRKLPSEISRQKPGWILPHSAQSL